MADTAHPSGEAAFALARILAEHKGGDVTVLDVATQAGWTDYFVIATASSSTHLRGLSRFAEETAAARGLSRHGKSALADDDEWALADYGDVVVHIMTERSRSFYELEKLWFQSPATKVELPSPDARP